jgi:NCAIR mutase (PurE)-related protein
LQEDRIKALLLDVKQGRVNVEEAIAALRDLPFEDIGVACIDHHRELRRGAPEVIFGEGKRLEDILAIMGRMIERKQNVLVTRLSGDKASRVREKHPESVYHERAAALTLTFETPIMKGRDTILVISAGTSDIRVAEEAAVTAWFMGNEVDTLHDVGISGIHRLLAHRKRITEAGVIVVVAGMEGALPSVVAGLVAKPVIAVPTSVGYGASFGGLAALLGMLTSCAAGVTVVNIDNGFGAGYAAALINRDPASG